MAPRVAGIPQYRERAALQTIKYRSWVPQTALHPAGEGTIAIMLKKGWIERQLGPGGAPQFRITEAGKAAIAASPRGAHSPAMSRARKPSSCEGDRVLPPEWQDPTNLCRKL